MVNPPPVHFIMIMTSAGSLRLSLTCWMRLCDVDHKEVRYIAEVLDELLELLKFVHKWGSGTTSKTQHQRPVTCREISSFIFRIKPCNWTGSLKRDSPRRTFHVLADTCFLSVHSDHRWVWSVSSYKSLLSKRQPHMLRCGFDKHERLKCRTPILILKSGILGHGDLFTHSEDVLLAETWWNKMHNPHYDIESYHIAKHACCRKIYHQFLQKHACSLVVKSRFHSASGETAIWLLSLSVTAHPANVW